MLESSRTKAAPHPATPIRTDRVLPIDPRVKSTDAELHFLSATAQGELIRTRRLSPVELTRSYLERIERYDPVLRAYITVCAERAMDEARAAEREIAVGVYRGPLHGLPFGVKDQICTLSVRTTCGTRAETGHAVDIDAAVVEKLKRAGAILIGKENLHECGKGGTNVFPYGQPRNPWDPERTPSSSSSGSGIAPAAGLCSASIGEDTGGSIRGPAAANGAVGLRPTYGRVSRYGAVMYAWHSDTIGPITRTVADNALLLSAIAGRDERDPLSSTRAVPDYRGALKGDLRGLRLAVVREIARVDGVHPDVTAAFERSVEVLKELGAEIGEVSLPWARHAIPLQMLTSDADSASMYLDALKTQWDTFDVGTRTRMATALLVPAPVYSRAMRARALVRGQVLDALKDWDALICPTHHKPAGLIDDTREKVESQADVAQRLILRRIGTHTFGASNVPTLALPMGFSGGMPLSLQIAGRPFEESTVYRIGHAYEQATPWHTRHPDLERTLASHLAQAEPAER
jgi:aspartyl-tRNA(Asn)/glutamyl-tRNA(Gln) amidotransferase subunit A